jgi:DNA mismatch repair ATPase MutS
LSIKDIYINTQNEHNASSTSSKTVIKNDCDLDTHMVITGPNASGKTTTIKSCMLNLILAQQFGFGCFETCRLTPVDNLHCYLNIPDTSGRDSLFQAEARRCKDIIDDVDERGSEETHFCIFDELYSGTNPDEAVSAAHAFMEYLTSKPNIKCLLTTHYLKLCSKLSKKKAIDNYHMKTNTSTDKEEQFVYTYKLERGISRVKGGIKVLMDMKFPKSILDSTIEDGLNTKECE